MSSYHTKKRLGQNFLKTNSIIEHLVSLVAPESTDTIVEIGAGRGALTLPLVKSGATVWAIEFDRDLINYLTSLLADYQDTKIINQDFLSFDPNTAQLDRFKLIGNLPYNITSPVIDWCLRYASRIESATLMVQKEVGARLVASPGNRDWSPLSISTQLVFEVESCFDVASSHFRPQPKVDSAVIRLVPRKEPLGQFSPEFEQVIRASFRQRRKLLSNNLVPRFVDKSEQLTDLYAELGFDHRIRAEALTIDQFLKLTQALIERKLV